MLLHLIILNFINLILKTLKLFFLFYYYMGDNKDLIIDMLNQIVKNRKPETVEKYVDKYLKAKKAIGDFNNVDKLNEFFNDKKPAYKHSYLWSIKTVLDLSPEKNKKALDAINDMINNNKKTINNYYQEQKKSIKENDNWISLKELQRFNKNQRTILSTMSDKFKSKPDSKKLRDYLLTSLYVLDVNNHPPRRVDYNVKLANKNTELDSNNNYLVIKNKSTKYFVFNQYKTDKTYGTQTFPVSKKLNAVINIYLKYNPDNKYLFQNNNGENITKSHLQKLITHSFKDTGKTIGVNMLRHIVISDTIDTGDKLKEKQDIAEKMGHSVTTQELYKKFDE